MHTPRPRSPKSKTTPLYGNLTGKGHTGRNSRSPEGIDRGDRRASPSEADQTHLTEGNNRKVGALGSGEVAKVLAAGFLKHGHDVMMGTRAPAKLAEWGTQNPKGQVGSFADAAKFADLVVLAVKGTAATEALRAAGTANL